MKFVEQYKLYNTLKKSTITIHSGSYIAEEGFETITKDMQKISSRAIYPDYSGEMPIRYKLTINKKNHEPINYTGWYAKLIFNLLKRKSLKAEFQR